METFFAILILAVVVAAFSIEYFQQKMGVSPMPTMSRVRVAMVREVPKDGTGRIVELGSGWGGIAFALARKYPARRITGVEFSLIPYWFCRIKRLLSPRLRNLEFVRRDFFDMSFHDISVILCYLSNPHMEKLKAKFERELPDGAVIVSSTFFIPDWTPVAVRDLTGAWKTKIFVYRK